MSRLLITACVAALASTAVAQPLRYSIQPKQVVPYNVTITVNTPTSIETMSGVIAYTGKKSGENTLTVEYSGGLNKSVKSKSNQRGFFGGPRGFRGPGGPRSPFDDVPFKGLIQATNTLVMTPTGNVKSMRGDSQLPYILGNLSIMPFETLPAAEQKEWTDGNGFSITTTSDNNRFGPRRPPFSGNNEDKTKGGGGESFVYRIQKEEDNLVTIAKTYSMTSPKANNDETGYKMEGTGTWTFNRELGVSESMDFKMDLTIDSKNVTRKYPITVKWNRMTEEAHAAHIQKKKDAHAALMAKVKAREAAKPKGPIDPKPMNPVFKRTTMFQLKSPVWQAARTELGKLAGSRMTGVVPQDMDMLTQVGLLRASKHVEVSALAEKVWEKWKHSFEEHASDSQRAAVAKAVGEEPAKKKMDEENPFVVEDDKDDGKGMRTWSDASGKFKIEGEFQKVEGAVVLLKNKTGRTVRIPKARLSDADKKIVEKLTGK